MKKYMEKFVIGGLVLMLPVSGFACSMGEWLTPGGVGAVTAASPPTISRYSEFCAMQATDTGHVQNNDPSAHTKFIARFYVRPQLTGAGQADLFLAYDNDTPAAHLFKVSYDGANLDFHAAGTTVLGTAPAAVNFWHLVEIEYNANGTTKFWVDADATTDVATGSFATPASTGVESVRLGLPNGRGGFAGSASFDGYESRSTTPVGPLLIADANDDLDINIFDFGFVRNEILGNSLATGQPDCNEDGEINIFDFGCVRNIILGN